MFSNRIFGMYKQIPKYNENEIFSIDLLKNQDFIDNVDHFTIRLHETSRPHYDIVFGSLKSKKEGNETKYLFPLCFDFVIGGVSPDDLGIEKPDLADIIQYRLDLGAEKGITNALMLPQEAHPTDPYLVYDEDDFDIIPEGEYGAGKWTIMRKGIANLIARMEGNRLHYNLYCYGNQAVYYSFFGGGKKWFITIVYKLA